MRKTGESPAASKRNLRKDRIPVSSSSLRAVVAKNASNENGERGREPHILTVKADGSCGKVLTDAAS